MSPAPWMTAECYIRALYKSKFGFSRVGMASSVYSGTSSVILIRPREDLGQTHSRFRFPSTFPYENVPDTRSLVRIGGWYCRFRLREAAEMQRLLWLTPGKSHSTGNHVRCVFCWGIGRRSDRRLNTAGVCRANHGRPT